MTSHRATTRRDFLATASLAMAGTMAGARSGRAANIERSSLSANALIPEPMAGLDFQRFATSAMDAARSAGASYADIRIAERHQLELGSVRVDPAMEWHSEYTHGVRVLVDGAWALVHGTIPSVDAVTAAARDAVAMARGYARVAAEPVELVAAPVVKGEWVTPFDIDPFTVPLRNQAALLSAYERAAGHVRGGRIKDCTFVWIREMRVFASTDETLTTQTLRGGTFAPVAIGNRGMGDFFLPLRAAGAVSGGYEVVAIPGLQDEIKREVEEAVRWSTLPRGAMTVDRYPVVLDGATLGMMLGRTLGPSLELDRVLGHESEAGGPGFLSPPSELLGTAVVSPLLTVTGNRALPTISAVKWDDEGVEPQEFSMIREGSLVDYPTTRATAPALRSWYERRGQPLRSSGCAVAPGAGDPIGVRAPHLTVQPSPNTTSLEELCKNVTQGLLVRRRSGLSIDPSISSASLAFGRHNEDGLIFEIKRGQIVRRVIGNALQVRPAPFWRSLLVALGDKRTVSTSSFKVNKGMPWRSAWHSAAAPAGLFKDVPVVSTESRA
jgi:TldD protein